MGPATSGDLLGLIGVVARGLPNSIREKSWKMWEGLALITQLEVGGPAWAILHYECINISIMRAGTAVLWLLIGRTVSGSLINGFVHRFILLISCPRSWNPQMHATQIPSTVRRFIPSKGSAWCLSSREVRKPARGLYSLIILIPVPFARATGNWCVETLVIMIESGSFTTCLKIVVKQLI